uniref:Putative secreted protein n=1 Tax=Anopheles darlingi TaxID=43151 RepID=A0A2M4DDI8_ANODA
MLMLLLPVLLLVTSSVARCCPIYDFCALGSRFRRERGRDISLTVFPFADSTAYLRAFTPTAKDNGFGEYMCVCLVLLGARAICFLI